MFFSNFYKVRHAGLHICSLYVGPLSGRCLLNFKFTTCCTVEGLELEACSIQKKKQEMHRSEEEGRRAPRGSGSRHHRRRVEYSDSSSSETESSDEDYRGRRHRHRRDTFHHRGRRREHRNPDFRAHLGNNSTSADVEKGEKKPLVPEEPLLAATPVAKIVLEVGKKGRQGGTADSEATKIQRIFRGICQI